MKPFCDFGSLALVGITGVHYNPDGSYVGFSYRLSLVTRFERDNEQIEKILWSRTLASEDEAFNPSFPLSPGTHRFTLGIKNPKETEITIYLSIDGELTETITATLSEDESFPVYDHSVYSVISVMNDAVFSNLSVFFNQPFPSDEWLTASQLALTKTYRDPVSEDLSILFGRSPSGFPSIEKEPGSLLNVMNGFLFHGTNHRFVTEAFPTAGSGDLSIRVEPSISGISVGNIIKVNQNRQSPFAGCWKIYAVNNSNQVTLTPALKTSIPCEITLSGTDYERSYLFTNESFLLIIRTGTHQFFRLNDLVTFNHLTDVEQSHSWIVTGVDAEGFDVISQSLEADYQFNDDCVIKQTPIGGGSWTKTFSENMIGFGYQEIEAVKKNIVIDDRAPSYSKVYLGETDNSDLSKALFIPKDYKNLFNRERDRFPSVVTGDCHRLYWFLPTKQNTVSHTSVISLGEVFDWFNQDWCVIAMVSASDSKNQDSGFNYAFLYPEWSIDPETGFLLCRSFKSHASDGSIKGEVTSKGYGDTGEHVYPINIPYVTFIPND